MIIPHVLHNILVTGESLNGSCLTVKKKERKKPKKPRMTASVL